tara:strand:- start:103 stop:246 length:144 start_codon:yes stop_codon:yes gene_type:complete
MQKLFKNIQKWFFELIEDALGAETMKRYHKEENIKAGKFTKQKDNQI